MTPEQRYFFDVFGYLHLKGVIEPEDLTAAQEAAERYVRTPPEQVPPGFGIKEPSKGFLLFQYGFAFEGALEKLAMHPASWPIVCELTRERPRLMNGTLLVNRADPGSHLHCAREEDIAWPRTHYTVKDGRIFCDNLVVFPYLTDVYPGDGGLIVLPGSHKASFVRPRGMFYADEKITDEIPAGIVNITPKAGDIVIISEALTHGTLTWKAKRDRRALVLRYRPQHLGGDTSIPEEVQQRLLPETRELIAQQGFDSLKEIVKNTAATA
jgi:hypothetical protein